MTIVIPYFYKLWTHADEFKVFEFSTKFGAETGGDGKTNDMISGTTTIQTVRNPVTLPLNLKRLMKATLPEFGVVWIL